MSAMRLQGKTAVITGASGDIGRAIVKAFSVEGAHVVACARKREKLEALAAELGVDPGGFLAVSADVSNEDDVSELMGAAEARFGKIDVLVCNSGIAGDVNKLSDYSTALFDQVIATNLRGTFLCMKHAISHMAKHGGGSIVAVSSIGGLRGMPGTAGYNASKYGINGLVMTASTDHAADGIRANAVCPSPVAGSMMRATEAAYGKNAGIDPELIHEDMCKGIPMGRFALPEEIANGVLFLASDEASFVNGAILSIDGGMAAQ